MLKLLLASIAVLLLATGTGRAQDVPGPACKNEIAWLPSKYIDPSRKELCGPPCDGKEHYFDMKKDPDQKRPLSDALTSAFRLTEHHHAFEAKDFLRHRALELLLGGGRRGELPVLVGQKQQTRGNKIGTKRT